MRVLVVGASGFIGRHIAIEAARAGHEVVVCGRNTANSDLCSRPGSDPCDFARDGVEDWRQRLQGADAVVNAAGIFQGDGANSLEAVHVTGPRALFEACAELRIQKLIQISALGADDRAKSRFHLSKRKADNLCLSLAESHQLLGWTVVKPSLVIGRGGQSTALFAALRGTAAPSAACRGKVGTPAASCFRSCLWHYPFAGAGRPCAAGIGFCRSQADDNRPGDAHAPPLASSSACWSVHGARVVFAGCICFRRTFLLRRTVQQSLDMLARGNTACVAPLEEALHWLPRPLSEAMAADPSTQADLWHARLYFFRPGAADRPWRCSWIATATISAFVYPLRERASPWYRASA